MNRPIIFRPTINYHGKEANINEKTVVKIVLKSDYIKVD